MMRRDSYLRWLVNLEVIMDRLEKGITVRTAVMPFYHRCALRRMSDEWLRHKIRTIYWKQWKKVRRKFKELKKLGVEEKAWICANMRNGNWYCGGYFVMQTTFYGNSLNLKKCLHFLWY